MSAAKEKSAPRIACFRCGQCDDGSAGAWTSVVCPPCAASLVSASATGLRALGLTRWRCTACTLPCVVAGGFAYPADGWTCRPCAHAGSLRAAATNPPAHALLYADTIRRTQATAVPPAGGLPARATLEFATAFAALVGARVSIPADWSAAFTAVLTRAVDACTKSSAWLDVALSALQSAFGLPEVADVSLEGDRLARVAHAFINEYHRGHAVDRLALFRHEAFHGLIQHYLLEDVYEVDVFYDVDARRGDCTAVASRVVDVLTGAMSACPLPSPSAPAPAPESASPGTRVVAVAGRHAGQVDTSTPTASGGRGALTATAAAAAPPSAKTTAAPPPSPSPPSPAAMATMKTPPPTPPRGTPATPVRSTAGAGMRTTPTTPPRSTLCEQHRQSTASRGST